MGCHQGKIKKQLQIQEGQILKILEDQQVIHAKIFNCESYLERYIPCQYLIGDKEFTNLGQFHDKTDVKLNQIEKKIKKAYEDLKIPVPDELKQKIKQNENSQSEMNEALILDLVNDDDCRQVTGKKILKIKKVDFFPNKIKPLSKYKTFMKSLQVTRD